MSTLNSYQPAALGSCGSAYLPYSTNDTKAVWLSLYSLLSPSNTNVGWFPRLLFYHPMTLIPTLITPKHKLFVTPTSTLLPADGSRTHSDYPTTKRLCGSHTYSFITWWPSCPLWLPNNTKVCVAVVHTLLSSSDTKVAWLSFLSYHSTTPMLGGSHSHSYHPATPGLSGCRIHPYCPVSCDFHIHCFDTKQHHGCGAFIKLQEFNKVVLYCVLHCVVL